LKLESDELLSCFAFKLKLRLYTKVQLRWLLRFEFIAVPTGGAGAVQKVAWQGQDTAES